MIVRRLAGLTLAATLLHLNVVRADGACAHHEQAPAPAPAQQDDHPILPHHDVVETTTPATDGHTDDEPPCDTPAQMDCCQALASCAPGMEIATELLLAGVGSPHDEAIGAFIETPLSRVTTPDPPPPKA